MYISLNTGASGCELQVKNKQYYINIGFDEHEQQNYLTLKTHTLQEYYSVRNSSNKCKKKCVLPKAYFRQNILLGKRDPDVW